MASIHILALVLKNRKNRRHRIVCNPPAIPDMHAVTPRAHQNGGGQNFAGGRCKKKTKKINTRDENKILIKSKKIAKKNQTDRSILNL